MNPVCSNNNTRKTLPEGFSGRIQQPPVKKVRPNVSQLSEENIVPYDVVLLERPVLASVFGESSKQSNFSIKQKAPQAPLQDEEIDCLKRVLHSPKDKGRNVPTDLNTLSKLSCKIKCFMSPRNCNPKTGKVLIAHGKWLDKAIKILQNYQAIDSTGVKLKLSPKDEWQVCFYTNIRSVRTHGKYFTCYKKYKEKGNEEILKKFKGWSQRDFNKFLNEEKENRTEIKSAQIVPKQTINLTTSSKDLAKHTQQFTPALSSPSTPCGQITTTQEACNILRNVGNFLQTSWIVTSSEKTELLQTLENLRNEIVSLPTSDTFHMPQAATFSNDLTAEESEALVDSWIN